MTSDSLHQWVTCPKCFAQTYVLAPHGGGPCPLAVAEHEATLELIATLGTRVAEMVVHVPAGEEFRFDPRG